MIPRTAVAERVSLRNVNACVVWFCRDDPERWPRRGGEWWPVCGRHLTPLARQSGVGHFHFQDADGRVCGHQHRSAIARCADVKGRPMVCSLERQECLGRYWKWRIEDWQHKWLHADILDDGWLWTCYGCGEERETSDKYPPPSDLYDRCYS